MRRLLKYLKGYWKESILGPLFKFLEASFELLIPLVMASIIDIGIRNRDIGHITRMAVLMVILGIVGLACSLTAQYFAAKAAVAFGTALRKDLFVKINTFSYTELDQIGTSTLITRLTSDVNQVQTSVNMVLRLFLRSPFIVVGAMIMAFFINVRAAIVFLLAIPVLSVVIFGIMLISIPIYKKVQNKLDKLLLITRENLAGVRVIRAFNRQKKEEEEFGQSSQDLKKTQLFVGKIAALMNPITFVIVNLSIIVIIWIGGYEVDDGIITQGEVIALVNYMSQILVELIKLANLIVGFTKTFASANRINQVLSVVPDMREASDFAAEPQKAGIPASVEFRDVSFRYKAAQEEVLEHISFRAEKGQTIGVIGGTGSGKTSLINLIPRFYDVCKGKVLVDGIDVSLYPFDKLRDKIGVVPQKTVLFTGSIRDNLKWGKPDASDEVLNKALEIAQAKEFVDAREDGLDAYLNQGGKNLSGGQKQRLTIARALAKEPSILILDDSASALDFATDAKLRKSIRGMAGEITVFIVSQRSASIRHSDQIIVLDDGRIAGIGKHGELFESCEVYREICLSQLSKDEAMGGYA